MIVGFAVSEMRLVAANCGRRGAPGDETDEGNPEGSPRIYASSRARPGLALRDTAHGFAVSEHGREWPDRLHKRNPGPRCQATPLSGGQLHRA